MKCCILGLEVEVCADGLRKFFDFGIKCVEGAIGLIIFVVKVHTAFYGHTIFQEIVCIEESYHVVIGDSVEGEVGSYTFGFSEYDGVGEFVKQAVLGTIIPATYCFAGKFKVIYFFLAGCCTECKKENY